MSKEYTYFKDEQDKEFNVASMKKYAEQKQEIDKFFETIIGPEIDGKSLKILDTCCGIGHILYFLNKISPNSTFVGIDQASYLIDEANKLCKDDKNISFEVEDTYKLPLKYPKEFDISINWKTLSFIPHYEDMLRALFAVTKKQIYISSLFYDGEIDYEIKVREYKKDAGKKDFNVFFNVYSYSHFEKLVYDLGAKKVEAYDFEINIDIPKGSVDRVGTYTVKLDNGKRLQISGAVVMSWKIIKITL